MAETFVFDIANSLLGKLTSYAYQEASKAYGVYEDLQGIKDTLSIVKGLLLDAEDKKHQQHVLREWLRQIQNICFDAEDVLDGFDFQNKRNQVLKSSGSVSMKVRHFFSSSNPLAFRFRMAHQIKDIRDKLDKVAADGTKFGLATISVDPKLVVEKREMTHSHVDASSVIGREADKENIIQLLMESHPKGDGDGERSMCVIPIVGIGGLGKTTLAKLVFNDKRVDETFQMKMWVCVSNDFGIKQIVSKIINSTFATPTPSSDVAHLDIEQLQSHLRQKISCQKFLLVLDDIWNDDRAKWIELKDMLKVGAVGSKIIVTTRSNSIASMMSSVPSYILEGLSLDNCLSLFVQWAFKEGDELKYPNLVEIGKEIVKKCQGVPLAVRTLGSSLFSKFDLRKWEFVRDHELWNLEQKQNDILPALKLSYDEMPSNLRHCFAFLSLFPKDYLFSIGQISILWVAVGLIQSRNGSEKIVDTAREYIDELHSRSFLLDFEDIGFYCAFKVHDLIHDLALYVAKTEFVVVDSQTRNIPKQVRHVSIVENDFLDHTLFPKFRSVRTISFPIDGVGLDSEIVLNTWISRYKYLRYLNLSDSLVETLPNSVGELEHLRVLILTSNKIIKRLPRSICKLYNLELLSLMECTNLEMLPKGLGKLISLRRLGITTKQSVLSSTDLTNLSHLQNLAFNNCDNMKLLFTGVQQFTSLELLSFRSCGSLESLPLSIFPNLQTLTISNCNKLNLWFDNERPIQRLKLKYLYIGILPELLMLPEWIEGATSTLETLTLDGFPNLKTLPKYLKKMTCLKRLRIYDCPQLLSLPFEMHQLSALENLHIVGCPELCRIFQPQSGEYWPMIAHIKRVNIGES